MTLPTFDNIFGQPAAIDAIRRAWRSSRLPHGLIFSGPAGVGKATTARALGALFLCERSNGDLPCGSCDSCRVFEAGNHPDFHVVYKELIRYHDKTGKSKGIALSIDVIRPELVEPANRKAAMNHGKVFVVEQADLMNAAAQNAMLKTLEEPAGRTVIILITDQPASLLQTIRSRCQHISFAPLSDDLVRRELQRREVDPSLAADAALFARGSLGMALKWLEDGVIERARELMSQLDSLASGGDSTGLPGWFKASGEAYAEKQNERDPLSSKDQANREGLSLYLHLSAEHLRRRLPRTDDPESLERTCAAIDAIVRAEGYLDANVNVSVILQQLALALQRELSMQA